MIPGKHSMGSAKGPVLPGQIFVRIAWLLGTLLALSLLALVGLHRLEKNAVRDILDEEAEQHGRLLDGVLELADSPLRLLVEGYARRTVFTRPNEHENAAKAGSILEAGLHLYGLDAAWVLEADGTLRTKVTSEAAKGLPVPIKVEEFANLQAKRVRFFMEHEQEIYEVRGKQLAAQKGRESQPRGWIFAAYRLDASRLMSPRLPVEGRVSLVPPTEAGAPPRADHPVRLERPLRNLSGRPLSILRVDYHPEEMEIVARAGSLTRVILTGCMLVSLCVLGLSVWHWVVRPSMLMQASLAAQDVKALVPLFAAGGDLARLAGFVQQSLENQTYLRHTLEQRARLGRDLHDGVIQTIYSAGLGLARVRNQLYADPVRADMLILEVRASLDHAVKELRRNIEDIEPGAAGPEPLQSLFEKLKVIAHLEGTVRVDIRVESDVEALLGSDHRVQLLHFASEAFSNALRHGRASLLELRLAKLGESALRLIIRDNGSGFDPANSRNPFGQGLPNLQQRAVQLGGELKVESAPGRGTRLELNFQPK